MYLVKTHFYVFCVIISFVDFITSEQEHPDDYLLANAEQQVKSKNDLEGQLLRQLEEIERLRKDLAQRHHGNGDSGQAEPAVHIGPHSLNRPIADDVAAADDDDALSVQQLQQLQRLQSHHGRRQHQRQQQQYQAEPEVRELTLEVREETIPEVEDPHPLPPHYRYEYLPEVDDVPPAAAAAAAAETGESESESEGFPSVDELSQQEQNGDGAVHVIGDDDDDEAEDDDAIQRQQDSNFLFDLGLGDDDDGEEVDEPVNDDDADLFEGHRPGRLFDDDTADADAEQEVALEETPHLPRSHDDVIDANDVDLRPQAAAVRDDATHLEDETPVADMYFLAVVAACSIAGLIGLVVAGVCFVKLQRNAKATAEAEYPAYGVTGPGGGGGNGGGVGGEKVGSPGDRKLAHSAQMYHYQHQKQQMLAMEKANGDMAGNGSDVDSEEENEEGDYTVYECPGLAPAGEMEVKNPLFNDDATTPGGGGVPNGHGHARMDGQ